MRLPELRKILNELKDAGFVQSERPGPTGVGYTLESRLGISENNLPIPDIGGRTEIKATRNTTNNLITLFTFNRLAWQKPQADIIQSYGYIDESNGRPSLYSTVSAATPNSQGLQVTLPKDSGMVSIAHVESGEVLATWDLFHIVGKFVTKFERLLLVHADARRGERGEEFHFNAAHLLAEPNAKTFRDSFLQGKALIDIRMHLKPYDAARIQGEGLRRPPVRNHGTGFRVREHDLPSLFGRIDNLLAGD